MQKLKFCHHLLTLTDGVLWNTKDGIFQILVQK